MEEGGRGETKEREDEAEEGWRDVQGEKAATREGCGQPPAAQNNPG